VPLARTSGPVPSKNQPKPGTDVAVFARSNSLDRALGLTADVRPEAVSRAKQLVADSAYPPAETIRKIANLLALHLDAEDLS